MCHLSRQFTRSGPRLNPSNTIKAAHGAVPFILMYICHGAVNRYEFLLHFYGAAPLGVPCFKFMQVQEHYFTVFTVKKLPSVISIAFVQRE